MRGPARNTSSSGGTSRGWPILKQNRPSVVQPTHRFHANPLRSFVRTTRPGWIDLSDEPREPETQTRTEHEDPRPCFERVKSDRDELRSPMHPSRIPLGQPSHSATTPLTQVSIVYHLRSNVIFQPSPIIFFLLPNQRPPPRDHVLHFQ